MDARPSKEMPMTAIEIQLIERLKKLSPARIAEVADFVEFLALREERAAVAKRLAQGLGRLDALKLPEITEDEVEAEVQATRQGQWLRDQLKDQRVDELFSSMDRMTSVERPAVMSPEEVAREIATMRAERRARNTR
jgi:hypothetical protein